MTKGICLLSVIPMRREAADQAEMVNQVLFGESFDVLEKGKSWSHIKLHHDQYEGWVDTKQITALEDSEWQDLTGRPEAFTTDFIELLVDSLWKEHWPILLGSRLPGILADGIFRIGDREFEFTGEKRSGKADRDEMLSMASQYLGAPYLWGGRSPFGIDCSGFTQMAYRLAGYSLPRDAYQQAELGQALSFIEECEPGDLAFFDNPEGKITHVGIILKEHHIIHASGRVRIDKLDQMGIFNEEVGKHTHKLRVIKKIL